MAQPNIIGGDLIVQGTVIPNALKIPTGSLGNTQFGSTDPLSATKQDHQYPRGLQQAYGSAASAERRVVHLANGAGSLVGVRAGCSVACVGDAEITVDVLKNGSTVLSSSLSITSATVAFDEVAAGISSSAYSAGDVFEVAVTVNAGTGTLGQGLYVAIVFREAAQ